MHLSLNWLKQYVNLPKGLSAKKLAHDLTMSTVEVESVENQAEKFENIVVGKIIEFKNHPNADKLKIVMVNIGTGRQAQIVCGGTNLKEGMLVAVALPGSKVRRHGEGEMVTLEKATLRGVESFGMICSANEIGLENIIPCAADEVMDLDKSVQGLTLNRQLKPGQNLANALGLNDVIIELDNKSITHRPDLWNHYGVARELSVIYESKLKPFSFCHAGSNCHRQFLAVSASQGKRSRNKFGMTIHIEDKKFCPRYIGCAVKNIKIAPSPMWLQKSLEAVGMRSINNIVDITNYVMLDLGEPMHAFDSSKVKSQKSKLNNEASGIIIRPAKKGEKITTLDGVERKLDETMLVIADEKKPIALAGIMGGLDSGVDENTTEIILEAANFDAVNIRKTSQKLNVRTEASNRFEKRLDPEIAWLGMQKALQLIKKILPEAEIGEVVDINYAKPADIKIKISHDFIENRMGQKINYKEVKDILERLGFEIVTSNKRQATSEYLIKVLSWRATGDIDCPEDIVEEVARIYGYNNLTDQPIHLSLTKPVYQKDQELVVKTKEFLALNAGLNEIFNYPWASEIYLKKLGQNGKMIELANPPIDDNKWLQKSLIPNLIKNIEDNLRYLDEFGIFELSRVYNVDKTEPKMLSGALVVDKNRDAFFETKGIIENLFGNLRITDYALSPYGGSPAGRQITKFLENYLNNEKCLAVLVGEKQIGWLGELKKDIYSQFNFKNRNICLWEINFDELVDAAKKMPAVKYIPLPQFPAVVRDLAFELDWKVRWADISFVILNLIQDPVINEIEFLSEFDLGSKKSVAFRIIYQANRTLKDEEVEVWQNKIIKLITEKFKAKLRK